MSRAIAITIRMKDRPDIQHEAEAFDRAKNVLPLMNILDHCILILPCMKFMHLHAYRAIPL